MTRFSLDAFRDSSDSDDSSSDEGNKENLGIDSEDEYEEPHPLGFGTTKFGLYDSDSDEDIDDLEEYMDESDLSQFFNEPLVRMSVNRRKHQVIPTTPQETKLLMTHHQRIHNYEQKNDISNDIVYRMDKIAKLVSAASPIPQKVPSTPASRTKINSIMEAAQAQIQAEKSIQQQSEIYKQKMLQKQKEDADSLLSLIKREEAEATMIYHREEMKRQKRLAEEQKEREKLEEQERAKQQENERKEQARLQSEKEAKVKILQQEEKDRLLKEEKEKLQAEREAAKAKRMEYILKAQKKVGKLDQVRASLQHFDTSKEKPISRRRLNFKKIAKGKMNTLSHEKDKVEIVVRHVVEAINTAIQEDIALRTQMEAGDTSITKDMARGSRYLMDLIASNVIVRVQAEGFNGTRGDGFPLAHMLAQTSTHVKEDFRVLIEAHIFSVCPTAIPTLPTPKEGCSEQELMESLGMQRNKDGEFETFERYMARTEGLISIMAEIMCSTPSDHSLLGGHRAALVWLARFLDLLPPDQSPLPLITAPVLVAFLTAAGHMLIHKFPDKFTQMFNQIQDVVVKNLDTSAIGQPSKTRLEKILSSGLQSFKSDLPQGAIQEFYDANENDSAPANLCQSVGQSNTAAASGFSSSQNTNPFGNTSNTGTTSGSAFGANSNAFPTQSSNTTPFGVASSSGSTNPFTSQQNQPQPSNPSPFAQASTSTPFGTSSTSTTPFATSSQSSTPFGTTQGNPNVQSQAPAPFGQAPNPSPFGQAPAPAPFGTSNTSPFGGGASQSSTPFGNTAAAAAPSPFGNTNTASSPFGQAPATTPFGQAPNPSPFGQAPASTPFGQAPASTPFGQAPSATASSPFGGQSNTSNPFGSSNQQQNQGTDNRPPCKFFAQGRCRNGANCKFSHILPGQQQQGAFGGSANATPFGNTSNTNASPFGGGGNNNGWNQPSNNNANAKKKQPCKFFQQGRCRNGANCKYSHIGNSSNNNASGFGRSKNNDNRGFGSLW